MYHKTADLFVFRISMRIDGQVRRNTNGLLMYTRHVMTYSKFVEIALHFTFIETLPKLIFGNFNENVWNQYTSFLNPSVR